MASNDAGPTPSDRMSNAAFAGMIRLWLTPAGSLPRWSPELDAYLRYLDREAPLSAELRRARSCAERVVGRALAA